MSWIANKVAGSKRFGGDGKVVNEIEVKDRTGVMLDLASHERISLVQGIGNQVGDVWAWCSPTS